MHKNTETRVPQAPRWRWACAAVIATCTLAMPVTTLAGEQLINPGPAPREPSMESKEKARLALVWCTNNVGKIKRGNLYDNQIIGAKENYFNKRAGLEQEPFLLEYTPKAHERPAIDFEEDRPMFEGKSYLEMIRFCDEAMMEAFNKVSRRPTPSNLAEAKIASFSDGAEQEAALVEQAKGKHAGFEGVTYGIVDSLTDLAGGRLTLAELQRFLIKPWIYDHAWRLTNTLDTFVVYEMWSGNRPLLVVVMRRPDETHIHGGKLPAGYYKVVGTEQFLVSYQGSEGVEEFVVLERHSL